MSEKSSWKKVWACTVHSTLHTVSYFSISPHVRSPGFCSSLLLPPLWQPYKTLCIQPPQHCTLHTARCTLHTAHCTLHTARCTLHTSHCTAGCTLHTTHFPLHCTLHAQHCFSPFSAAPPAVVAQTSHSVGWSLRILRWSLGWILGLGLGWSLGWSLKWSLKLGLRLCWCLK